MGARIHHGYAPNVDSVKSPLVRSTGTRRQCRHTVYRICSVLSSELRSLWIGVGLDAVVFPSPLSSCSVDPKARCDSVVEIALGPSRQ